MNDRDAMARYRGEIERNLDAAERLCEKIHAEHGNCYLGTYCAFHAAFKKNRPFGCEVMGIGSVMGEHRPPGLCPHGKERGKEVLCHSQFPCTYKKEDPDTLYNVMPLVFCTREALALAAAEEPAVPCPKCGSPTFTADIDGGMKRLCMNDACKWKAAAAEAAERAGGGK